MTKPTTNTPDRHDAKIYQIRLLGHLDARWAHQLDAIGLCHETDGTTALRAAIADQPALHGLLNRIRDLGIPLISVTLEQPSTPSSPLRKDVR
ncbi:MAG: hypothetical protein ABL879_03655 [Devosia sp.]